MNDRNLFFLTVEESKKSLVKRVKVSLKTKKMF